jgi:exosortase/archaeosortase family protein
LRHRGSWLHGLGLALLVPPIAILANLARVIILLLITHAWGDAVAQGLLHRGAGLMMFLVALAGLLASDALLSRMTRA